MKKTLFAFCSLFLLFCFAACSEDDEVGYNAYGNWPELNMQWFGGISAQARAEIAKAKAAYGDQWEENCPWRVVCRTDYGKCSSATDSVVLRMVRLGSGERPYFNDSVLIHYRGWLCPTRYMIDDKDTTYAAVFDQSFYGKYAVDCMDEFDDATATPVQSCVKRYVTGFASALQHMHEGDQAHIYIPCNLAYGLSDEAGVPVGSALHFFVSLVGVYPVGTTVPKY